MPYKRDIINKEIDVINLLIAIDIEVKYQKWHAADAAVRRLDAQNPADMRRLFVKIYRLFPSTLLFQYEAGAFERSLQKKVA